MAINWDVLKQQSTERLEALETQISENIRREIEAKRRAIDDAERKKRKKRKRKPRT
jgi:hypothetical protein